MSIWSGVGKASSSDTHRIGGARSLVARFLVFYDSNFVAGGYGDSTYSVGDNPDGTTLALPLQESSV